MKTKFHPKDEQVICLHHNDTDGRAAAAVVRKALGSDIWLCEMDYGDTIPLEKVISADHIIIVDFSLPRSEMETLAAYHSLTWIDHHKSSIEEMGVFGQQLPGIRDVSEAACVLTWSYYFPKTPIPRAIILIGDRDIWRWAEANTGAFNEGLYHLDTRPFNDTLWRPLLDDDAEILRSICEKGEVLREARLQEIRRTILRHGYPVTLEGHKTLAVNVRGSGDIGEQIRSLGYDIAYCYIDDVQNGELNTYVTLYSKEVDVSKIAIKLGGGGHSGAAGFHFKRSETPFPESLKYEILRHG